MFVVIAQKLANLQSQAGIPNYIIGGRMNLILSRQKINSTTVEKIRRRGLIFS